MLATIRMGRKWGRAAVGPHLTYTPQPPNSAAAAEKKIRRAAGPAEIYGRRRRIFIGAPRR